MIVHHRNQTRTRKVFTIFPSTLLVTVTILFKFVMIMMALDT